MTTFSLAAPRLAGIVAALPETLEANTDLGGRFGAETMAKIIASTGIERRPVAGRQTVAGMGEAAARHLLDQLGWEASSIGLVVVVTQTPDYPLPATSCLLQQRLGLSQGVAAFDLGLGCSGFVYALSVVASMLANGVARRALLIAGDVTTSMIQSDDRALLPLFGDAVVATALEAGDGSEKLAMDLGTDGTGAPYLTSRSGGRAEPGEPRLVMDGVQVMAFSLREVAPSIARVLGAADRTIETASHVVLHQANSFMLKRLGDKIGARPEQLVLALRDYGNTSSASIPLALASSLSDGTPDELRLLLSGFGVGWSWASAYWPTPAPSIFAIIHTSDEKS